MEAISKQFMEEYDRGLKQNALIPLNGRVNQLDSTTVKTVKVGSTSYSPSNGVVTLPEYPEGGGEMADKKYDPEHFSGLGRKTLKLKEDGSNVLTYEDFDQDNTIYIISYDFSFGGDVIEFPNNCILKFEGGSIKHGSYIVSNGNHLTVYGYGLLVWGRSSSSYNSYNNTTFMNPYHVDNLYGGNDSDGSPEKPFKIIQEALNLSNNIVLRKGRVFGLEQLYDNQTIASQDVDSFGTLRGNTSIGAYGTGCKPIITTRCTITNATYLSSTVELDISNAALAYYNGVEYKLINVSALTNQRYLNFGYLHDIYSFKFDSQTFTTPNGNQFKYSDIEFEGSAKSITSIPISDFKKIKLGNVGQQYHTSVSLGFHGISASGYFLNIDGIRFESIGCHAIHGFGSSGGVVNNCEFERVGGTLQSVGETFTPWGNAVEIYNANGSSKGLHIKNCSFTDIFDAACTIQGSNYDTVPGVGRFIVDSCTFTRCCYGVELFDSSTSKNPEILVSNNRFVDCFVGRLRWLYYERYGERPRSGAIANKDTGGKTVVSGNVIINSPILAYNDWDVYMDTPGRNDPGVFINNTVFTNTNIPVITHAFTTQGTDDRGVYLTEYTEVEAEDIINAIGSRKGTGNAIYSFSRTPSRAAFFGNSLLNGFSSPSTSQTSPDDQDKRMGMAASRKSKDYYHRVCRYLKLKNLNVVTNKYTANRTESATSESLLGTYVYEDFFRYLTGVTTDMVVIQIGDNVDSGNSYMLQYGFKYILNTLRSQYVGQKCKIYWVGLWFNRDEVYNAIVSACEQYNVTMIDIRGFYDDNQASIGDTYRLPNSDTFTKENVTSATLNGDVLTVAFEVDGQPHTSEIRVSSYSLDTDTNVLTFTGYESYIDSVGVSLHPNDKGFELIADEIIDQLDCDL